MLSMQNVLYKDIPNVRSLKAAQMLIIINTIYYKLILGYNEKFALLSINWLLPLTLPPHPPIENIAAPPTFSYFLTVETREKIIERSKPNRYIDQSDRGQQITIYSTPFKKIPPCIL